MLIRLIDSINEAVGWVVSTVAIIITAIIIYDVVMRYFFHEPTRWAFDVAKQLYGFYFIMLGGYALRHKAHVRVDLLIDKFSPNTQRWIDMLGYVLFFFPFLWVLTTFSYRFAMRSWQQGEVTYGSVQVPVYPLKMAMFVAAVLLLLQGIAEFLKLLLNKENPVNGS